MEVRLDAFSATTLLASNTQQSSDRIKARFRHQNSQIMRDIMALGKLVQETQASISTLTDTLNSQSVAAQAVEKIAQINTVRQQLERSEQALEYLRCYTDLPQKISAFIDSGELAQAWGLVDSVDQSALAQTKGEGSSVGISAEDARKFEEQIETAVIGRLEQAIVAHDTENMAEAARLLQAHGRSDTVQSAFLRIRSEAGAKQLRPVVAKCQANQASTFDTALQLERSFVEAAGMPQDAAVLLETLLASYIELLQPAIQLKVDDIYSSNADNEPADCSSSACVADLYQNLSAFYADLSEALSFSTLSVGDDSALETAALASKPIPQSLSLLFAPFVPHMALLASTEAAHIRRGSLARLRQLEPDYERIEAYVRDASMALLGVFVDIENALERVFAFVPASKLSGAISEIAAVVVDISTHFSTMIRNIAEQAGIPLAALDVFGNLAGFSPGRGGKRREKKAIYQTLANADKLETVSSVVGVSLLSRIFDQYASALSVSIAKQWDDFLATLARQPGFATSPASVSVTEQAASPSRLLLSAFMESCATIADMRAIVISPLLAADAPPPHAMQSVEGAGTGLSHITCSMVFFLLTSAFRLPLARIPTLSVWRAERQSKSSMNIEVPLFSCSPSEEAVDIGEKMHVLLPELEQIEVMDSQYTRSVDLEGAVPHYGGSDHVDVESGEMSIQPMLSLLVSQICSIGMPPLSDSGRQQLAADMDYIASVVLSFTNSTLPEFNVVRRCVWQCTNADDADMPPDLLGQEDTEKNGDKLRRVCEKMQALLDMKEERSTS
ncbi:hypothetical protein BX661DRAFT_180795 [Kickxella alabastrina]|uniref:uncharacterized protein n=1 Tax=Kickxella alabastrina TaxID=61397 RepID=UPI00221E59C2|nr:uncharacterized protein BX661DRAFT_180795 [Kickxella alabastrina]KAI7829950.1 hypothetical protein BX661DRAFT_180795 [Kickxella alabastrina]